VLNISDRDLNLAGWTLRDEQERSEPITGSIRPGEAITLPLSGSGVQLSNEGGTITLLDAQSLKVDGVAYTRADAQTEGRPVVFR
jgi:hypothetical protein